MTAATGRILGLDIGLRRTGVALSDPGRTLATPLETVESGARALVDRLLEIIREQAVGRVVIGLPRMPSGDEGEVAELARAVGAQLERAAGVEVVFQDEGLTSWEAGEILRRGGRRPGAPPSRGGRRGKGGRSGEVDRLAAALILQEHLEGLRAERGGGLSGRGPRGAAGGR